MKNRKIKIGAIYGRVSDDGAAEVEHGSPEQQKNLGLAVAKQLSESKEIEHRVEYILIEENGVSGGTTNRPRYQELLDLIRSRKIDYVIAKEISRISRSTRDFCDFMALCKNNEVSVHIRGLDVDPNMPMGNAMFQILAVVAELEREMIRERTRSSMRSALIHNGKLCGGSMVLGFDRDPQRPGFPIPNKKELESVGILMQTFNQNLSYKQTCKEAEKLGIKNKNGRCFNKGSLKRLLTNTKYIGRVRAPHENEEIWVNLPGGPVISNELFEETQLNVIKLESSGKLRTKTRKRVYPLTNILFFEDGSDFKGISGTSKTKDIHYYYYNAQNKISLKAEELEGAVVNALRAYENDHTLIRYITQLKEGVKSKRDFIEAQIAKIEREITDTLVQEERLLEIVAIDSMGDKKKALEVLERKLESFSEKKKELESQLVSLRADLRAYSEANIEVSTLKQTLKTLFDKLIKSPYGAPHEGVDGVDRRLSQ